MSRVTLAQVGTWADARNAHLAHVPLHRFAVDRSSFLVQYHRDPARAIKRMRGVDFVNAVLEGNLLGRGRHWLIVQARAIQAEQLGLPGKRQSTVLTFDHRLPLIGRQRRGQIFF